MVNLPEQQCGHDLERIFDGLDTCTPASEHPPSLKMLICIIQKILFPEPLYTKIADFLRLLSMVEFWRIRAMSVVSNALVYQEFSRKSHDHDLVCLPQPVEALFKDHEEHNMEWRGIFMQILSICLEVHLQRIWITRPNTEFWAQWNEYYSPLETLSSSQTFCTFHHDLSIDDMDQLLLSMENCKNFINETLQSQGAARDASKEVLLPLIDEFLLDMIHLYLSFVSGFITEVNEVFPAEFPLPAM